jgi:hypothetical protein
MNVSFEVVDRIGARLLTGAALLALGVFFWDRFLDDNGTDTIVTRVDDWNAIWSTVAVPVTADARPVRIAVFTHF